MNLMHFLTTKNPAPSQLKFLRASQFPLDDEVLADAATNAMLLVMSNSHRYFGRTRGDLRDHMALLAYGVHFPWKGRIAHRLSVDLVNDKLPAYAAIASTGLEKGQYSRCGYICAAPPQLARKLPALTGASTVYRVGTIAGYDPMSRQMAKVREVRDLECVVRPYYAGVMPDGTCVGATVDGRVSHFAAATLAYVVGMHNDRRHLWNVTATEEYLEGFPAKASFSIDQEYVKSLFYARSLPMTQTGRMRPILHWVRAHKRRLKEGVDLDIGKHLRGVDAFSMHGVKFEIDSPRKNSHAPARPRDLVPL